MGLFGPKYRKPTTAEKNEINSILSRTLTTCKHLEDTDSIDKYFTEWSKYLTDYQRLLFYESQGIKFNTSLKQNHALICAEVPRLEIDIINRGYDRMMRDAAKVTTEKAKQNRANKFFNELEYYYPRLQTSSVEHIESLKRKTSFISNTANSIPKFESKYCVQCGALLDQGSRFCGKCGSKV